MIAGVDLLTVDRAALEVATWSDPSVEGIDVAVRKGDCSDPLAGVVRIREATSRIDVVVAKWVLRDFDVAAMAGSAGLTNAEIERLDECRMRLIERPVS